MKKLLVLILSSIVLLVLATGAMGEPQWKEVKAGELKQMMETENVLVVFPLSRLEFNDLHIKGSVNIPMHELKEKLPKNKNSKIVFYCLGRR